MAKRGRRGGVERFGERFQAMRVAKGISRAEAARAMDVHVTNLMDWEDLGKLPKDPRKLVTARDLLGCDGWWLLSGEGRP